MNPRRNCGRLGVSVVTSFVTVVETRDFIRAINANSAATSDKEFDGEIAKSRLGRGPFLSAF